MLKSLELYQEETGRLIEKMRSIFEKETNDRIAKVCRDLSRRMSFFFSDGRTIPKRNCGYY